jgi:hypothetical protein
VFLIETVCTVKGLPSIVLSLVAEVSKEEEEDDDDDENEDFSLLSTLLAPDPNIPHIEKTNAVFNFKIVFNFIF